jgi:hypothetical protein
MSPRLTSLSLEQEGEWRAKTYYRSSSAANHATGARVRENVYSVSVRFSGASLFHRKRRRAGLPVARNRQLYVGYLLSEFRTISVRHRVRGGTNTLSAVPSSEVPRSSCGTDAGWLEQTEGKAQKAIVDTRDCPYRTPTDSAGLQCGYSAARGKCRGRLLIRACRYDSGHSHAMGRILLGQDVSLAKSDHCGKVTKDRSSRPTFFGSRCSS